MKTELLDSVLKPHDELNFNKSTILIPMEGNPELNESADIGINKSIMTLSQSQDPGMLISEEPTVEIEPLPII